jgi:hypothetical protein
VDIFDLVLNEDYAPADAVAYHIFHEVASFLKNVKNTSAAELQQIVKDA